MDVMEEPVMTEQVDTESVEAFLEGLADAFGLDADARTEVTGRTTVIRLDGEGLNALVGPRGATLQAVQDLARTVGAASGSSRFIIDIGGYRERRTEALRRFATQIAEEVARSGQPKALEPMHSADRKAVHDAVGLVEGVSSTSEGTDPNRRIVISPAS
jgi:spoIIIJ-associated protein